MKQTIFILFVLGFSLSLQASKPKQALADASNTRYVCSASDTFVISATPITNREYLLYLIWLRRTYSADYPNVFLDAFPGGNPFSSVEERTRIFTWAVPFATLAQYAPDYMGQYMLNFDYLDYPVVGLTRNQASSFCRWLSDRYNEYILIKNKKLSFNENQVSEDCFTTEAHLAGQYIGMLRYKKEFGYPPAWNEGTFVPTFRLPTQAEMEISEKNGLVDSEWKAYPTQNSFLKEWYKFTIHTTASYTHLIDIYNGNKPEEIKKQDKDWKFPVTTWEEITLDSKTNPKASTYLDAYRQNGQEIMPPSASEKIKDSLGIMQYMIVGEDAQRKPIYVKNHEYKPEADSGRYRIFRYVCNVKPSHFKK